jgi:arginyl-tRNA synthetase
MAADAFPEITNGDAADLDLLRDPAEVSLIKLLAQYPRVIEAAAKSHEPHRIAYYLYDLAAAFHGLWTKGREHAGLRFIVDDNRPLTASRLALVRGVRIVIASGLNLMGVVPVEELR